MRSTLSIATIVCIVGAIVTSRNARFGKATPMVLRVLALVCLVASQLVES